MNLNNYVIVLFCVFFIAFLLFIHSKFDDLDKKHIFLVLSVVTIILILVFDYMGMGIFY